MQVINCPQCGGSVKLLGDKKIFRCEFCQAIMMLEGTKELSSEDLWNEKLTTADLNKIHYINVQPQTQANIQKVQEPVTVQQQSKPSFRLKDFAVVIGALLFQGLFCYGILELLSKPSR